MNPLLISGFGNYLSVDKRKLIIQNKMLNSRLEFYPHQIDYDSVIVDGHTGNITFEAIRWLMKHDITLSLLNWNGNLLGVTLPQGPKAGKLRIAQYAKHLDKSVRRVIAEKLVEQKIAHSHQLLKELSRYYASLDGELIDRMFANEEINYKHTASSDKSSINLLMMYEGRIATFYWDCLATIFNKLYPDFYFKSRKNKSYSWNMNASDEVNALLNYGYAILETEVRRAINAIGLDPTIGFLHELAASKTPLIYDIQELFRWLVDLSVIHLLEEKKLKKTDFIVTENFHIRLREQAASMLIEKISLNINKTAKYKGKNYSYQTILQDNVQSLANFIIDKQKGLAFDIPQMSLAHADTLELCKRISSISPSERRRLGINKSTLWYQQKQLNEGKTIKLYGKVLSKYTEQVS